MTRDDAEIFLARRYLAKGFLDDAFRLFMGHPAEFSPDDWAALRDRLLERGRVTDAVTVCRVADVPLPREEILSLGDQYLARADIDRAIDLYEMGEADPTRWEKVVDRLIELPDRLPQARTIAEKHLSVPQPREAEKPRLVKIVK